jgi:hypothetical protein
MSSERQVKANRQNAQLSSGPRGIKGKARVAANALKHGLTAKRTVLPNEDPKEFEAFRSALHDDLDPQSPTEELLVQKFVADAWRIMRSLKLERAVHTRENLLQLAEELKDEVRSYTNPTYSPDPTELYASDYKRCSKARTELEQVNLALEEPTLNVTRVMEDSSEEFARLWRHEEALSRSLFRTLHELERLQAKRRGERVAAPGIVDVDVNIRQEKQNPEAILQNKAN